MALYGRSAGVSVIIEGCFEEGFKGEGVVDTDECERRVTGVGGTRVAGTGGLRSRRGWLL